MLHTCVKPIFWQFGFSMRRIQCQTIINLKSTLSLFGQHTACRASWTTLDLSKFSRKDGINKPGTAYTVQKGKEIIYVISGNDPGRQSIQRSQKWTPNEIASSTSEAKVRSSESVIDSTVPDQRLTNKGTSEPTHFNRRPSMVKTSRMLDGYCKGQEISEPTQFDRSPSMVETSRMLDGFCKGQETSGENDSGRVAHSHTGYAHPKSNNNKRLREPDFYNTIPDERKNNKQRSREYDNPRNVYINNSIFQKIVDEELIHRQGSLSQEEWYEISHKMEYMANNSRMRNHWALGLLKWISTHCEINMEATKSLYNLIVEEKGQTNLILESYMILALARTGDEKDAECALTMYDKLTSEHEIFDYGTAGILTKALAKTPRWRECSQLIEMAKFSNSGNVKPSFYNDMLEAAVQADDMAVVDELCRSLSDTQDAPYEAVFHSMVSKFTNGNAKDERSLDLLRKYEWIPSLETVEKIKDNFERQCTNLPYCYRLIIIYLCVIYMFVFNLPISSVLYFTNQNYIIYRGKSDSRQTTGSYFPILLL